MILLILGTLCDFLLKGCKEVLSPFPLTVTAEKEDMEFQRSLLSLRTVRNTKGVGDSRELLQSSFR